MASLPWALNSCQPVVEADPPPPLDIATAWQDSTTECVALNSGGSGLGLECNEVALMPGDRLYCGNVESNSNYGIVDLATGQVKQSTLSNNLSELLNPLAATLGTRLGISGVGLSPVGLMGAASDPRQDSSASLFTLWTLAQSINGTDSTATTRWLLLLEQQADSMTIRSQRLMPLPHGCTPRPSSSTSDSLICLASSDGLRILVATTRSPYEPYGGNEPLPAEPVQIWEVSDSTLTAPIATGLEIGGQLRAFSYTSAGWQLVAEQRGGSESGTVVTLLDSALEPQSTRKFLYGTSGNDGGDNDSDTRMGDWIQTATGEQWVYLHRDSSPGSNISSMGGEGFLCRDIDAFFGEVTP